jgi:hypothetical protein
MENSIIKGLTISESEYKLEKNGKGKIAVFMYVGGGDPRAILDYAIKNYVDNIGHYELMDASLGNPWMRVILSNINDIKQEEFDTSKHKL